MVDTRKPELAEEASALYERYGKPLEAEHWGEYVVIARDGRTVLSSNLAQAMMTACERLGSGTFAFKVGEIVVSGWRS